MTNEQIINVANEFQLCGEVVHIEECHNGHINRTYFVSCKNGDGIRRYVMQMINTGIFKKPDETINGTGISIILRLVYMAAIKNIIPMKSTKK